MSCLWKWQWFCLGVAVTLGGLSMISQTFGGLRRVPRAGELPGIVLTNFLDTLPERVVTSKLWEYSGIERLEAWLDNYECPADHEYRMEIVNHEPLIFRLRGFLPQGEATHLLKLADGERQDSFVARWTADDPTRTYLEPDEDRVVACLEQRIASMSGYKIHHQEAIQIVRNEPGGKGERPNTNIWPEWLIYDTPRTRRAARMLVALDIQSENPWEVDFPVLEKQFILEENDALFWWNLLPNGTFDPRISHKVASKDEAWSANVFINEGFWRPEWWEPSS